MSWFKTKKNKNVPVDVVLSKKEEAFRRVKNTLNNGKYMIHTKDDGVYIRLAGDGSNGEAFTLEWGKVLSIKEES